MNHRSADIIRIDPPHPPHQTAVEAAVFSRLSRFCNLFCASFCDKSGASQRSSTTLFPCINHESSNYSAIFTAKIPRISCIKYSDSEIFPDICRENSTYQQRIASSTANYSATTNNFITSELFRKSTANNLASANFSAKNSAILSLVQNIDVFIIFHL